MNMFSEKKLKGLALNSDLSVDPAFFDSICNSPISKELGLAEKLARELSYRHHAAASASEAPNYQEIIHAIGIDISRQVDDESIKIQSLIKNKIYIMSKIYDRLNKTLKIFQIMLVVQAMFIAYSIAF